MPLIRIANCRPVEGGLVGRSTAHVITQHAR
jgi:hypothetical protein